MKKPKPKPKVESPTTPQPPTGGTGGQAAPLTTLDPSQRRDRTLIRLAQRDAWPITPETKALIVDLTTKAMRQAAQMGEARDVAGCARVLVAADQANQKDVHELEKYDRIDAGKATDAVMLIDDLAGEEKKA